MSLASSKQSLNTIFLVVLYLTIGAAAGFLGGLLGVGGGVIVVPCLIFLFENTDLLSSSVLSQNATVLFAAGTSMASIVFTTGSSALAQHRRLNIDWSTVKAWLPYLMIGAFASSYIAKFLPVQLLKTTIGTFLIFVAAMLLVDKLPTSSRQSPRPLPTAMVASAGGLISGVVGIGGGNVVVPSLLYFNTPITRAAGVASTCGVGVALSGALGYTISGLNIDQPYTLGYIYLPALIPIAITNIFFAPIGVHYAHRLPSKLLKRIFGGMMCLVAAQVFYGMLFG